MIDSKERPAFIPRGEEKVFYERLREHELVFHRCAECASAIFPLRTVCTSCGSESLELEQAAGTGVIYSFTTQYRAAHPHFSEQVPYSIALVDLDEGIRVFASVRGIAIETLAVGLPVSLEFDDVDSELTLLRVSPAVPASALKGVL